MWGFDNTCRVLRHQQCPSVPRSACVTTPRNCLKPTNSLKPDCPEVRPVCPRFFDPGRSCSAPPRRRPCDVGIPDKRYCHISPGRPRSVNLEPTVNRIPLTTYIDQHQSRSTKNGKKKTNKQLNKQPSKSKVRKKQVASKAKNPTKGVEKTSPATPQKSSPPSSSNNKEVAKTSPPQKSSPPSSSNKEAAKASPPQKSSPASSLTKEVAKTCSPIISQKSSTPSSSTKEMVQSSPPQKSSTTSTTSTKEVEKTFSPIISRKSSTPSSSTKEIAQSSPPQKSSLASSTKEVEKTFSPIISQKSSIPSSSTTEVAKTDSPIISQKSSIPSSSTTEVAKTDSPIVSQKSSTPSSTKEMAQSSKPLKSSSTNEVMKTGSLIISQKSSLSSITNSEISEPTCDEKCESRNITQPNISEHDSARDKTKISFVDNAEDHEYVHFLLRITEDILRNNMYTNSGMNEVFESHLEANRGRLSEEKMRGQIERLKKELNYPLKDKEQLIESVCQCNDIKAYFKDCRCCPLDKTDSNTLEQDSCVCKDPKCAGDDKTIEAEIVSLFEKVKRQSSQCTELEIVEDDGGKEDEVKKEQDTSKEDVDGTEKEDDENEECDVREDTGVMSKAPRPSPYTATDIGIREADVNKKDDLNSAQEKSSQSIMKKESSDSYTVEGSISKYLDVCDDACPQKIDGEESKITYKSENEQEIKETDGGLSKKNLNQCIDAPGCQNNNLTRKFSEVKIEEEKANKPQPAGPVCSKLNSSFKMIQKDENMEKKLSQIAFYNTDAGEVCHCTITLRKTALKIESDEDNDQEYILVEGPVCMPKTLLEEKTIPVMIENLSSILEDSNSDIRADADVNSTSSRVNFFVSERAAEEASRQNHSFNPKSVSSHIINRGQAHDYDLTPERDFSSEGECLSSAGKQENIFPINQGVSTTCASDCNAFRRHIKPQSKTSVMTNKSEEKQEDEPVEELKESFEEKLNEQQDKSERQSAEQPKQLKGKLKQIPEENVEEKPKKKGSSSTESSALEDVVSNKSNVNVSKINLFSCSQCDVDKNQVTSHQLVREDIDGIELIEDTGLDPSEKCCCGAAAILMGPDYYVGDGDSKKSGISPSECSTASDFQRKYHFLLQDVAVSCTSLQIHEADKLALPVIIPTSVKEQLKQPSRSSKSKEPYSEEAYSKEPYSKEAYSKKPKLKKSSYSKNAPKSPKAVVSNVKPESIQTKSISSIDKDSNDDLITKERKISIDKYYSPQASLEIHSTSSTPHEEELPRMFQYSSKGTKQESEILSGSLQSNETAGSNLSNTRRPYWHNDGTDTENEDSENSIQDNLPGSDEYQEEIDEQLYREQSDLYQPKIMVPPNEDEEDYDYKDIISKLDEIPQSDSLDKRLNNAHSVTNKLENFRKLETKETEKRFQSYANTDNFEIRRQISSESDKRIEENANQAKKQKSCCKISKSKK